MDETFYKNEGHTDFEVSVRIYSDRQEKCRSTKLKMDRTTSMKTEQAWMAAAAAADDDDGGDDYDDGSVHM